MLSIPFCPSLTFRLVLHHTQTDLFHHHIAPCTWHHLALLSPEACGPHLHPSLPRYNPPCSVSHYTYELFFSQGPSTPRRRLHLTLATAHPAPPHFRDWAAPITCYLDLFAIHGHTDVLIRPCSGASSSSSHPSIQLCLCLTLRHQENQRQHISSHRLGKTPPSAFELGRAVRVSD
ncbi:hypothetical protein BCV69DRAFT_97388 [Microstroma glucosiphilum]|uniref:Uncharacterized protein n=1 Tax=Pseudomicrostroma glucosiphilum TaxID=1684307 RepID=A0A316UFU0_9BASI|nr:hypothetical protein BCV69DRAFT_97388 [Pseudomicrostroma glucosiphilum]PWN22773.1 hypothetical protein BCV69DRAFT_97388 [Pseudomicrostroma glucosiphilum]